VHINPITLFIIHENILFEFINRIDFILIVYVNVTTGSQLVWEKVLKFSKI